MGGRASQLKSLRGALYLGLLALLGLVIGTHVAVSWLIDAAGGLRKQKSAWWTPLDLVHLSTPIDRFGLWTVIEAWGIGLIVAAAFAAVMTLLLLALLRPTRVLDSHGTARWAKRADVVEAGLLEGRTHGRSLIIGGWVDPRAKPGAMPEFMTHNGPESILNEAPSRSGKTASIVIPNLLCYESSVFVLDVKGELWEKTSGYRQRELKQPVMYHDPSSEEPGACFNPLAEIDALTRRSVSEVQMLMQYLVPSSAKEGSGSSNESHFVTSARSLGVGVFLYEMVQAALSDDGGTTTISAVLSAITRPDRPIKEYLQELAAFKHGDDRVARVVRETAGEMLQREDRESSGVLSSLVTPLTTFRDPILAHATSRSDFAIADLVSMERPCTLYLIIRPSDRDRLNPYLGMIINLVCRKLTERLPAAGETRHELLLLLDEFSSLPPLPVIKQSMDVMPGYGIKAVLIVQDYETLPALYGEHETLSSNCLITISYTPSKPKTAKIVSERTGMATVLQETSSEQRKPIGMMPTSKSENEGFHSRALLTPDEVTRLGTPKLDQNYRMVKPGEALVFARGCFPIRCVQTPYFLHPELADRAGHAAPSHSDRVRRLRHEPERERSGDGVTLEKAPAESASEEALENV